MSDPYTLQWTDLDRRIWEEELADFVPRRVFDVHTHLYRWAHNLDPEKGQRQDASLMSSVFAEATFRLTDEVDQLLFPGREVHRLAFPFPFPQCDFVAANAFLASQLTEDPSSAGLLLVHPGMSAEEVEALLLQYGFIGLKPYRFYSRTGEVNECRLTDFLPEEQIALANRLGLIIMMHLSKREAIADRDNIEDIIRLSKEYPRVQWILAHCARSYSAWAIEAAASQLRGLQNVWYDTSSVCESDAIDALYQGVGADRVMYGSDDLPVGVLRGKYIAFGRAWAYLSPNNHSLGLTHCDERMTFTRYEQLRAMRRACLRLGMSTSQIDALFHDTAVQLISRVRQSRN